MKHILYIILFFVISCHPPTSKIQGEKIDAKIIKISTNQKLDLDSSAPPEIYYQILLENNSSLNIYLDNTNNISKDNQKITNFQLEFDCNGSFISFNLYSITNPIRYININSSDIINLKLHFKEILDKQNACGYTKTSNFAHDIITKGKIVYMGDNSKKTNSKLGIDYSYIRSFSIATSSDTNIDVVNE